MNSQLTYLFSTAALCAFTASAHADVLISTDPTQNMTCSGGICSPTAADAVLNVKHLANMLATGDTKVTTGSGAVNIDVVAALNWSSTSRLTLDANTGLSVQAPVTVAGNGALTFTYNDGGSNGDLIFSNGGNATLANLSSSLIINGNSYTLIGNIQTLAEDIAANPAGSYALAADYDALADGHYKHSPFSGSFTGVLEGLNHNISNLTVHASGQQESAGLFGRIESDSTPFVLRDIQLTNVDVASSQEDAGALAGDLIYGYVVRCYSSGKVNGYINVGGLVGFEYGGTITGSGSSASVRETGGRPAGGLVGWARESNTTESFATGPISGAIAGGLAGENTGTIERSYASGAVTGSPGRYTVAGGLVGVSDQEAFSKIYDSYATGAVTNHGKSFTGGLVGYNSREKGTQSLTLVATSYSTGEVQGRNTNKVGGLVGEIDGAQNDYWDVTTSGTSQGAAKGCNKVCQPNVTGLTDDQLKSALPAGFDPNIWGQSPNINNGYPYLLANPPQ